MVDYAVKLIAYLGLESKYVSLIPIHYPKLFSLITESSTDIDLLSKLDEFIKINGTEPFTEILPDDPTGNVLTDTKPPIIKTL